MSVKFPNFLENDGEYDASQRCWSELFSAILSKNKVDEEWESWFDPKFGDGTPIRNGNPILNRVCWATKKVVLIVQENPSDFDAGDFCAFMDTMGAEDKLNALVISCTLTERSEVRAKHLIECFVVEGFDSDAMTYLISREFTE